MEHDLRLRAATREIYEQCYSSEDWAPWSFDEAECYGTVHYRQAMGPAQAAKFVLQATEMQLALPVLA